MASNSLVTCSVVAKESLAILENMVSFSGAVNRDFESEFTGNMSRGYAPGQTINIKRPPRYTYRAGRVAVPQATQAHDGHALARYMAGKVRIVQQVSANDDRIAALIERNLEFGKDFRGGIHE